MRASERGAWIAAATGRPDPNVTFCRHRRDRPTRTDPGRRGRRRPGPGSGPKQPIERLSISGGLYKVNYGNPGCFTGEGNLGAAYAVPAGATLLGATIYAVDSFDVPVVSATLN